MTTKTTLKNMHNKSRKDKIEKIIEVIEGCKTGHSSYSCRNGLNDFCVCGAKEDRWNLAIDNVIEAIKDL